MGTENGKGYGDGRGSVEGRIEPRRRKLVRDIEIKRSLVDSSQVNAVDVVSPSNVEKTVSGIKKEPVRKQVERSVRTRRNIEKEPTIKYRELTFLNRGVFEQLEEGWVNMDESTDSEIRKLIDHQRGMLSDFHDYLALVLTTRWDDKDKRSEEKTEERLCYSRIVAAPRTGKTNVAAEIGRRTNMPFIFVVPTKDLRRQAATEFKKLLPNKIVTEYVDGINLNLEYDVMVVSYQLLQSRNRTGNEEIFDILKHYPLVFLDEGHGSTTDERMEIIREKFDKDALRIALTGTPDYSEKRKLEDFYPNEIHTLTIAEAVEMGIYSPFMYEVYEIDIDASHVRLNKDLEYDPEQMDKIMSQAPVFAFAKEILKKHNDAPGLVTCTSKSQIKMLLKYLDVTGGTNRKIEVLTEDTPNREEVLKKYENGEIDTLIVVKLLLQGWDSPRCKLLVDIAPSASPVTAGQKFCRPLTKNGVDDETQAYIYSLVPSNLLSNPISPGDVFSVEDMPLPPGVVINGSKKREKTDKEVKIPKTLELEGVKVRSVSSLLEQGTSRFLTPEKLEDRDILSEIIKSACVDPDSNKFDENKLMNVISYKKSFDRTIFRSKYFVGYGRQITRILKLHDDVSFSTKMQETFPEEIGSFLLRKDNKREKTREMLSVSDDVRILETELRKLDEDDETLLQHKKDGTMDSGEIWVKQEKNQSKRIMIISALQSLSGEKRYPYEEYDVAQAESFIDEMIENIDVDFLGKFLDKLMNKSLTGREISFIKESFFEKKTLKEIGDGVGITSSAVGAVINNAIDKIKRFLDGVGLEMITSKKYKSKYKKIEDIPMEEKMDFIRQHEDIFFREKGFFDKIKKSNEGDFVGEFLELTLEGGVDRDYVIELLGMIANAALTDRERLYLDERIKKGNSPEKIAEILGLNLTVSRKIDRKIITKVKSFFDMVGEEMDKTGDYKDNRITSVPEKIAFVKEHEDLFFIEKSFFDQIRNDVDRDCLKVFFDKTIGFIDDERDNNYWKELLVKIVKKRESYMNYRYFYERIKEGNSQKEVIDNMEISLSQAIQIEKNIINQFEIIFDIIEREMRSRLVEYKNKKDISIKEKVNFLIRYGETVFELLR